MFAKGSKPRFADKEQAGYLVRTSDTGNRLFVKMGIFNNLFAGSLPGNELLSKLSDHGALIKASGETLNTVQLLVEISGKTSRKRYMQFDLHRLNDFRERLRLSLGKGK